jgi:hypothetical protein
MSYKLPVCVLFPNIILKSSAAFVKYFFTLNSEKVRYNTKQVAIKQQLMMKTQFLRWWLRRRNC